MCERVTMPDGSVAIVCGRNHHKRGRKSVSEHDDIDGHARDYKPQTGQLPGPEALADGTHDLEIVEAKLTKTPKTNESIFRLTLRAIGGPSTGALLERATFFRQADSLNWLGGDMMTLGLDADQWGKRGRPWSQELIDACPRLRGKRFTGQKVTKDGYHNLYVRALLHGAPMPGTPAPAQQQPALVPAGVGAGDDEIPF
jgi:hypothetical protein